MAFQSASVGPGHRGARFRWKGALSFGGRCRTRAAGPKQHSLMGDAGSARGGRLYASWVTTDFVSR